MGCILFVNILKIQFLCYLSYNWAAWAGGQERVERKITLNDIEILS
jgi:hypothetical protein